MLQSHPGLSSVLSTVPFVLAYFSFQLQESKLRGSSSVIAKSIDSIGKIFNVASIAIGVKPHTQNECWNYEETKDRQKMTNSWCLQAHQKCCSSQKKYEHDIDFCKFYGFKPEPDDSADGITVITESSEEPIDCTMCGSSKCNTDGTAQRRNRPTRNPTKMPTEYPTDFPTLSPTDFSRGKCKNYEENRESEREANTWCFQAHRVCCSSAHKYSNWRAFCSHYGFEDPGVLSKAIAGYAPWTFITIDCTKCDGSKCYENDTKLQV